MLKQIPIDEALRRFVAGERVLCLVPGTDADDWANYMPQTLDDILRDVIAFADEPIEPMETIDKKTKGKPTSENCTHWQMRDGLPRRSPTSSACRNRL